MSVDYEWRLRVLMAERGMFRAADLAPRLAEHGVRLSDSQVWRLVTGRPERLNLRVLVVLCEILGCEPGELVRSTAAPAPAAKESPGAAAIDKDMQPKQVRLRRPAAAREQGRASAERALRRLRSGGSARQDREGWRAGALQALLPGGPAASPLRTLREGEGDRSTRQGRRARHLRGLPATTRGALRHLRAGRPARGQGDRGLARDRSLLLPLPARDLPRLR